MQLNRIYNEDCLVGLKQITTESIDLVVTDCPYRIEAGGVKLVPDGKECGGVLNKRTKHISLSGVLNDHLEYNSRLGEDWR